MPRVAARTQRSVETARALNPDIEVAVRSHNDEEAQLLQREVRAACSSAKVNWHVRVYRPSPERWRSNELHWLLTRGLSHPKPPRCTRRLAANAVSGWPVCSLA